MSVIKEWRCSDHGDFESSHPICPAFGCDSKSVNRVILTPPGYRSDASKRFDQGIRRTADGMKLGNLRSAKPGEAAYGGEIGKQVLWGDDAKKVLGMDFGALVDKAAQPFEVTKSDGSQERVKSGMHLQTTLPVLPPAERTAHRRDGKP